MTKPTADKLPAKKDSACAQIERRGTNTRVGFSEDVFADTLERIACGEAVSKICGEPGYPSRKTFYSWVLRNDDLRERYEVALVARHYALADETLEIADQPVGSLDSGATDTGAVQKQRLQVDTRKWLLSKMVPKKYGDKLQQEVTGANGGPVAMAVLDTEAYKKARKAALDADDC